MEVRGESIAQGYSERQEVEGMYVCAPNLCVQVGLGAQGRPERQAVGWKAMRGWQYACGKFFLLLEGRGMGERC